MSHTIHVPGLIILEGADGVGKSTLGRFLANHFGGFYFHATATKTLIPAMQDYQVNLMENVEENVKLGNTVIMDRFWPSELVYGSVFRPNNPHGFEYAPLAERCRKLHAIYVYCFSSTAVERHKHTKDPKHPYDDGPFKEIYRMYEKLWESLSEQPENIRYDLEAHGSNMRDFANLIHVRHNNLRASR